MVAFSLNAFTCQRPDPLVAAPAAPSVRDADHAGALEQLDVVVERCGVRPSRLARAAMDACPASPSAATISRRCGEASASIAAGSSSISERPCLGAMAAA